jgi:hypothetical protein
VFVIADEDLPAPLRLCMATKAKIRIGLHQHLAVDRAVRLMTGHTPFTQSLVLEDKTPRLFAMTTRALFVGASHGQSTGGFHDIGPVYVMALHAVHFAFAHGMMLREVELSVNLQVAVEASLRVLARVEDEPASPTTRRDMFAARAVTRLTARAAGQLGRLDMQPRVRTGGEDPRMVGVAIDAGFVAGESGTFDLGRWNNDALDGGAGNENH